MKLLATYPSERAARRAVRALEAAGIDPSEIRVDAPQDDRDELKAEQHDEVSSPMVAPGVPGTGVARRAALGGSIVGIPMGAILGMVIGFAAFRTHFVAVITCMIAFGVAGWVAMALWAVYSAATEKQEATESELRAQVIVGVHTNDKAEIERAQMILRGTDPHRMDIAS
jgi:predicted lipid-binding transport protein (Tim44 family)